MVRLADESDHALAVSGELVHQIGNVGTPRRNSDALCLAPREVEDLRPHRVVVNQHVHRLQGA
jgi:hypothetical protein